MRTLLFLCFTGAVFSAHDDFRSETPARGIAYELKSHYDTLSSVLEHSPLYRWKHLRKGLKYSDYRTNKYLHRGYLPFDSRNAHFRGIRSLSPNLHKLRPYPTDSRSLEIRMQSCREGCNKISSESPFIF